MNTEDLRRLQEVSLPNPYIKKQFEEMSPAHTWDMLAQKIIQQFHPQKVLDFGCGTGELVASLRGRGVHAFGIDVSDQAIAKVNADLLPYVWEGAYSAALAETFDLIICLQTLADLPDPERKAALENICSHTSTILFTAAPIHAGNAGSPGFLTPGDWAELFARHNFYQDLAEEIEPISPWFMTFRKKTLTMGQLVREYADLVWKLRLDIRARRSLAVETHSILAEKEQFFQETIEGLREEARAEQQRLEQKCEKLAGELQEVYSSRAWRFGVSFRKVRLFFFPHGSRRERWLKSLFR